MTEGEALSREKDTEEHTGDEPKGGRPGPTDRNRDGGMATREIAPEVTVAEDAQEPPD